MPVSLPCGTGQSGWPSVQREVSCPQGVEDAPAARGMGTHSHCPVKSSQGQPLPIFSPQIRPSTFREQCNASKQKSPVLKNIQTPSKSTVGCGAASISLFPAPGVAQNSGIKFPSALTSSVTLNQRGKLCGQLASVKTGVLDDLSEVPGRAEVGHIHVQRSCELPLATLMLWGRRDHP